MHKTKTSRIRWCWLHRQETIEGREFCPLYLWDETEQTEDCDGHLEWLDADAGRKLQAIADAWNEWKMAGSSHEDFAMAVDAVMMNRALTEDDNE